MRAPLVVTLLSFLGLAGLAASCGGGVEVGPGPGDGGSSTSSSGSSSGSSTSSGSSSGVTSSGTSSGGVTCQPLPGCNSSTECPAPGGCGTCLCDNGDWECTGGGCGDDVSDAFPNDDASVCPFDPPQPGTFCSEIDAECGYGSNEGCGETCSCQNVGWECFADPCPPPLDSGLPDTSFFDSGPVCPEPQPNPGSACSDEGNVCSYFNGCDTNCLCANGAWVCATQEGCVPGDF